MSLPPTHAPDFGQAMDLHEQLDALPEDATVRGLYVLDVLEKCKKKGLDLSAEMGLGGARYRAFKEYPYADFVRMNFHAAERLHPNVPTGEGLRRLGQGAYDAFVSTQVGRVLLGAVGRNFSRVAKLGCRAYSTSLNFGKVTWTQVSPVEGYYTFVGMPIMLTTYQVGVVEGGMQATLTKGHIEVASTSLGDGYIRVLWD